MQLRYEQALVGDASAPPSGDTPRLSRGRETELQVGDDEDLDIALEDIPVSWKQKLPEVDEWNIIEWAQTHVATLRNIPLTFKQAYNDVVTAILDMRELAVNEGRKVEQRRCEKLLLVIQVLLNKCPKETKVKGENPSVTKSRRAKYLHRRYYMFLTGRWDQIVPWAEEADLAPPKRRRVLGENQIGNENCRRADGVIASIRDNNLRKAVGDLSSPGVAGMTKDTVLQLRELPIPQPPPPPQRDAEDPGRLCRDQCSTHHEAGQ
jgi:hypothetical protein